MSRPFRFSIEERAENESFQVVPLRFQASLDSRSAVEACVSFERFSP